MQATRRPFSLRHRIITIFCRQLSAEYFTESEVITRLCDAGWAHSHETEIDITETLASLVEAGTIRCGTFDGTMLYKINV